jgi:uncharacterized membrane protein
MEDINFALLISRWLHIGAAIVAIGGVVFLRFVLNPSAAGTLGEREDQRLREAIRVRWKRFVHICIGLLLLTGGFNFVVLAMPPKVEPFPYHMIFGCKFILALMVFFLAGALVATGPQFAKMRQNSGRWLTLLVVLAALIVGVSGVLGQLRAKTGRPIETTTAASES